MVRWYIDIYPCSACENRHMLGGCRKGHETEFVGGCNKCGIEVNSEWYYKKKKCKDFDHKYFDDPSGS